ncbi:hypothetical protein F5Y15DRAFT_412765 [Xylariaceae sp. FL0016]|nr:hypothetical protein F5Y15DRAFT_412765 [Xylariaceae sp. FL0016]
MKPDTTSRDSTESNVEDGNGASHQDFDAVTLIAVLLVVIFSLTSAIVQYRTGRDEGLVAAPFVVTWITFSWNLFRILPKTVTNSKFQTSLVVDNRRYVLLGPADNVEVGPKNFILQAFRVDLILAIILFIMAILHTTSYSWLRVNNGFQITVAVLQFLAAVVSMLPSLSTARFVVRSVNTRIQLPRDLQTVPHFQGISVAT